MNMILEEMPEGKQTALFSATIPPWIKRTARRVLVDPLSFDLIGNETRTSTTLKHFRVICDNDNRRSILSSLLMTNSAERAIVFAQTKAEVAELSSSKELRNRTR